MSLLGQLTIPAELDEHVQHIFGLSELVGSGRLRHQSFRRTHAPTRSEALEHIAKRFTEDNEFYLAPTSLRQFYGVPDSLVCTNSSTVQAVGQFEQYLSTEALDMFSDLLGFEIDVDRYVGYVCNASDDILCAMSDTERCADAATRLICVALSDSLDCSCSLQ